MLFFSENLDNEQKNQLGNVVPVWFRLRYEKEILSHFIDENILDLSIIDSLPLQKLCEEICVTLKLNKTVSPNEPEQTKMTYIKEVILNSKWYEFFDFIEVVGDLLSDSDYEAVEVFENLSKNDDLYFDISLDVGLKLDNYSHETYLEKVNKLFLSHLPMFYLADKGRIHLIESFLDIEKLFTKSSSSSEQSHTEKITTNIIISTETDWLIEQGKDLFDNSIRDSIQNAAQLVYENQYKDALKILRPTIEEICNKKIKQLGNDPTVFSGLSKKAEFLESQGYLPKQMIKFLGAIDSRNTVSHGYSLPSYILYYCCQNHFGILRFLTEEWIAGSKTPDMT